MWLEAVFSRKDLESLAAQFVPLKILLRKEADRHIEVTGVRDISLVPDRGLRLTCQADVRWPFLGIELPVRLETLTALLTPAVTEPGDRLSFSMQIEDLDLATVPAVLDRTIADKLNVELAEHDVDLAWNFARTLSHRFELPSSLEPVDGLDLRVRWGRVRVTEEAMVMAVSFQPSVLRHDVLGIRFEPSALVHVPPDRALLEPRSPRARRFGVKPAGLVWGALAVGLFFAAVAVRRGLT
jgi:hypothetical protein